MKKIKLFVLFLFLILIPLTLIKMVDNYFSERTNEFLEQAVTFAASVTACSKNSFVLSLK